jgi:hypothetical protein
VIAIESVILSAAKDPDEAYPTHTDHPFSTQNSILCLLPLPVLLFVIPQGSAFAFAVAVAVAVASEFLLSS